MHTLYTFRNYFVTVLRFSIWHSRGVGASMRTEISWGQIILCRIYSRDPQSNERMITNYALTTYR